MFKILDWIFKQQKKVFLFILLTFFYWLNGQSQRKRLIILTYNLDLINLIGVVLELYPSKNKKTSIMHSSAADQESY